MATNKNAIIRYQALDKCFRNTGKNYAMLDLIAVCNKALYDFNGSSAGIKRRQVYEDINFMKSEQGYGVELEVTKQGRTAYYRYVNPNFSINNQPMNETEAQQLKEALLTLNRIKGMPQFGWVEELTLKLEKDFNIHETPREILGFENNPYLKGLEYLNELFNAILYKKVLSIGYQTFRRNEVEEFSMHPQYLKQYNNRWFVLGTHSKYNPVTTLAIDRIEFVKESSDTYIESDIDFTERYEDIIGITRGLDTELTKITLHANTSLSSYMITSPLHGSQKNGEINKNGLTFTLDVIPNYELEQQILSYGEAIKVVEPTWFVQKIKDRIKVSLENY
ncbi:putative DNA-binding transcriptional regulator YafY [Wenyingzhuangia heitensis]|uniref:DNA-binding transcriptional regulator YafY n=1 Tax=Wenyingzhuangia heitensis TaxID=1487859 RepID=A0ABX0U8U5_9FLAO|nr:WYL domain-containing protein [Wenyingzhuangia heitensis]NIJ45259.1 putative DNA-binding transcriptional regulator YafY [Wenyingzhuangia heitensis]